MKKFKFSFAFAFLISVVMFQTALAAETWEYLYEPQFEDAYNFSGGWAVVIKDGQEYYVDQYGNTLQGDWDYAYHFTEGRAMISVDGKYGYIDLEGNISIAPAYDDGWAFSDGLALVMKDGRYYYIDYEGNIVLEPEWDDCFEFENGLAMVVDDGEWEELYQGYLEGTVSYDALMAASDSKWGYIDKDGQLVIDTIWDDAYYFQEGLALVEKEGYWGYILPNGIAVIAPQYQDGNSFSDGLAAVQKDGLWGFIDTEGNVAIPFQFDSCGNFQNGLAVVSDASGTYYINKEGKKAFAENYNTVYSFSDGFGIVEDSAGQHYYIDETGAVAIASVWDDVFAFKNGFAIVEAGGLYGYITYRGEAGKNYILIYQEKEYPLSAAYARESLLPLRETVELLGGSLEWHPADKTVTILFNETEASFSLYSSLYQAGEGTKEMAGAPVVVDGRIYLPVQYLMDALNFTYTAEENLIYID